LSHRLFFFILFFLFYSQEQHHIAESGKLVLIIFWIS